MPPEANLRGSLAEIIRLIESLPTTPDAYASLTTTKRRDLREKLQGAIQKLEAVWIVVDPVRMPKQVFDLSDPKLVGKLVADTLLLQPRISLAEVLRHRFYGAGVYAIYYNGPMDCYAPIARKDYPIYVGKADPVDLHARTARQQGERLFVRLRDHERSISATSNLSVADFDCRYLVVRSAWVETAENHLIEHFKPVWNKEMRVCHGFGKHGDDAGTRANRRSPWDTLHPGRLWATRSGNTPNEKSLAQIRSDIAAHFAKHSPDTWLDG